jgi:hypothetical protein
MYVDTNLLLGTRYWRKIMLGLKAGAIAAKSIVLAFMLGAAWHAMAQDTTALYPNMAPLDQYLIEDRGSEIALARSAAPESISREAEVLVLGRHGYETAIQGKNGFVCCASWNAPGLLQSMIRGFGILRGVLRSALTQQPHALTFHALSRRRN